VRCAPWHAERYFRLLPDCQASPRGEGASEMRGNFEKREGKDGEKTAESKEISGERNW
jgi:hypothetical protein